MPMPLRTDFPSACLRYDTLFMELGKRRDHTGRLKPKKETLLVRRVLNLPYRRHY